MTRKATTGVVTMLGKHCLKSSSNSQQELGLSSGENEFCGIVKGSSVGLGFVALAQDLHVVLKLRVRSDSSAAIAMASRRGLGKVRHISLRYLWVQQRVHNKEIELQKESGDSNLSDLQTKHLAEKRMLLLLRTMGFHFMTGRAASMPKTVG